MMKTDLLAGGQAGPRAIRIRAVPAAIATWCLAGACSTAIAQVPPQAPIPDAGRLQRQQQDEEQQRQDRLRRPEPSGPAVAPPAAGAAAPINVDTVLLLRELTFTPSKFLTDAELNALVAPMLNTTVKFADLQALLEKVNALYRDKGQFAARAILPPQQVRDGKVQIQLVEAVLDEIKLDGALRTKPHWVRRWITNNPGQVLDVVELESSLQRWNAGSEAKLGADLIPSAKPLQTNVQATLAEPEAWRGSAYLANEGSQSTGRAQLGATLRWYSPLGLGDTATAGVGKTRGSDFVQMGYAVPVHPSGLRMSAALSHARFHIVDGPFTAIGIEGTSSSAALGIAQPFYVKDGWLLEGNANLAGQRSETLIGGLSPGSVYIRNTSVGLTLTRRSAVEWSVSQSLQRSAVYAPAGQSGYNLGLGSAYALVPINDTWAARGRLQWQQSYSGNLPGSLFFQAGGASSVRGYDGGVIASDAGYSAGVDFIRQLGGNASGYLFVDTGAAHTRGGGPTRHVTSVGFGADWRFAEAFTASGYVAHLMDADLTSTGRKNVLLARVTYNF